MEWYIPPLDESVVKHLTKTLKIPHLLAKILFRRGFNEPEAAYRYLYPRLIHLHNPWMLKDIKRAIKRIYKAIVNQEKVVIYGDYDTDGITSTAILYLFLSPLISKIFYYLPHRLKEGYGLNAEIIKKFAKIGIDLLITTDCGISNKEEIALANQFGLDVIVIDHHEVPKMLPPAYAIINPKQPNCPFPFKELAGVGVTFNVIIALRQFLYKEGIWSKTEIPNLKAYLDLVALGTIADMVPLIDENRIFVKCGLEVLNSTERIGLKILKDISGLQHNITVKEVAFRIVPRLNVAGRLGDPQMALKLLLTNDEREAYHLAQSLNELNRKRQRIEENILREAQQMIKSGQNVLISDNWHPGVIGIVAGRLAEINKKPIILITFEGETGRGSGRSIEGFDLFSALSRCAPYLKGFGGHKSAAGLKIEAKNISDFLGAFEKVCKEMQKEQEDFKLFLDAKANLKELTSSFMQYLSLLPPYGLGNPEPLLLSPPLTIKQALLVQQKHLKLFVFYENLLFEAIGFNFASFYPPPNPIQLVFTPYIECFQGESTVKLKIQDLRGID